MSFRLHSNINKGTPSGLSINDFKLIEQVGRGGFGKVYLCKKRDTNEILALKVMEKSLIWKRNKVRQIKNERDVLVNHITKYFVRLMYSFQDKTNLYLAMEFCPGGDLRHLLADFDVLCEEDARVYMAQMIIATHHLHQCGYIHRDLKPDNFLIDKYGYLKLADFGLSKDGANSRIESHKSKENLLSPTKHVTQASKAYSVVGSPNYMSPEVLKEEFGYSVEVDWWSLGCIFFEMTVGYPPFTGATPEEVFQNVINWQSHLPTVLDPIREYLSEEAVSLIEGFLCEKKDRLGSSGLEKIKHHPFFVGFEWSKVDSMEPPFIPSLRDDFDTSYFDHQEEKEVIAPGDALSKTPPDQIIDKENIERFNLGSSRIQSNVKYHYRKRSQDETRPKYLCSVNYIDTKKRKRFSEKDAKYVHHKGLATPDSNQKSPNKEILGFTYQRKVVHKSKTGYIEPFPLNMDAL